MLVRGRWLYFMAFNKCQVAYNFLHWFRVTTNFRYTFLPNNEICSFFQAVHLRATTGRTVLWSVLRTVRAVTVTSWRELVLGANIDTLVPDALKVRHMFTRFNVGCAWLLFADRMYFVIRNFELYRVSLTIFICLIESFLLVTINMFAYTFNINRL